MSRLKVGLVGTYYPNFAAEEYGVYPQAIAGLEALGAEWGFDLVAVQSGIQTVEEAEAAQRELRDASVDFILVQASSFALGDLLIPFARMDLPLGLWGVPEPSLEGEIPLNSLTALNMFASILRVHLDTLQVVLWPGRRCTVPAAAAPDSAGAHSHDEAEGDPNRPFWRYCPVVL